MARACPSPLVTFRAAVRSFFHERASETAAGVTFYTIVSIFPIILILIALGSRFVESQESQEFVLRQIIRLFPAFSKPFFEQNVLRVVQSRAPVTIVGAVMLLWSGSNVFSLLSEHLNRAWGASGRLVALRSRLSGVALVGILAVLTVIAIVARAAIRVIPVWLAAASSKLPFAVPDISQIGTEFVAYTVEFLLLLLMYHSVPAVVVRWRDAAVGAVLAAAGSLVVTELFALFLASGLNRYNVVYGSFGVVVAFLFWVYLVTNVVLFGAHLGAACAERQPDPIDAGGIR
jgi:YihY family inner membrane protein